MGESTDIGTLKADIAALEDEVKRLRESAVDSGGLSARSFVGEGNRQYLTGLNLGGRHIVILLDVSASMLADRVVNIIRLRNMAPTLQRQAGKWVRALNTVDWLTAALPINSSYQVITFNTQAGPALDNSAGKWLEVANQPQLESVTAALRDIIPSGGTSLENAF
ncbi:MAG TPA: VWA domain-containing protein, partial [Kineobactrum sp.]